MCKHLDGVRARPTTCERVWFPGEGIRNVKNEPRDGWHAPSEHAMHG